MSQIRLYLDEDSMRKSLVEADMINRQDEDHLTTASAAG